MRDVATHLLGGWWKGVNDGIPPEGRQLLQDIGSTPLQLTVFLVPIQGRLDEERYTVLLTPGQVVDCREGGRGEQGRNEYNPAPPTTLPMNVHTDKHTHWSPQ